MLSHDRDPPPIKRTTSGIRPDATYPDPMDRPDGGPRLPDNPHAGGLIPEVVPPLPRESLYARRLPWRTAFTWLRLGWGDLVRHPLPSLLYGLGLSVVSVSVVWLLRYHGLDSLIFPALAGFLVLGPLVACGLYEKSRRLEAGEPVRLLDMLAVWPRSGRPALFMGVLLMGLFLLWNRAAVILYALFFGLRPFPGLDELVPTLLTTPEGWGLLLVGSLVGAIFAAFAFAISAFAFPMLLGERTDALSAMGISLTMVWNNLAVMLAWGAIVLALFLVSVVTLFVGFVVIFPVLGHATWHAYRQIRPPERQQAPHAERMFVQPA